MRGAAPANGARGRPRGAGGQRALRTATIACVAIAASAVLIQWSRKTFPIYMFEQRLLSLATALDSGNFEEVVTSWTKLKRKL